MRIVLAEDAALIREGLVLLLDSAGHEVVEAAADAPELISAVEKWMNSEPGIDMVITDVRMPPHSRDDGLQAALAIRKKYPALPIIVLSAYVAGPYVHTLLEESSGGIGYLLKERVGRVEDFLSSLDVVAGGGVVVDPEVISFLIGGAGHALARLTKREREVLELMARGLSNREIGAALTIAPTAVSKHVANVLMKLDLPPGEENRRVRAVLTWLQAQAPYTT